MSPHARTSHPSLQKMRLPELQARYREVIGEATRSPNRTWLIRRIEEALAARERPKATQEQAPIKLTKGRAPEKAKAHQATAPAEQATQSQEGKKAEDFAPAPAGATPSRSGKKGATPAPAPAKSTSSASAATTSASAAGQPATKPPRGRFSAMTVEQLQAMYLEVVGRPTGSDSKAYLLWKIREAEKGRIPVGHRPEREVKVREDGKRVIPLSFEAKALEGLDKAWRNAGMPSRTEFFRRAIRRYLVETGAPEVAALFAPNQDE
ncbi:ribbon-helix-helix domain-containing protein [Stigmatella aurantiaca]|uniref:Uncharacterized protein n=1 Tax=Stigmatella aurantiaca (strain DW4/3-1) TaxID=378806 RepID=Q08W07_STIAD|nr:ribbon-helix-helix domain-containing protein [Stigmatella aurantiaca]ADO70290.1 uncharacterized protein STAUR_2486 [Stigmatella aurantiaca DW4/3-1]EAU64645.1 hypothetical protein STIAU_1383 [Stigmatella aurantiaca DW4/3-1]